MKKQSIIPIICLSILSFSAFIAVASTSSGQVAWMKCCENNQPPGQLKCSECSTLSCCYKACLRGCSSNPDSILYKKCAGFCDRNF